MTIRLTKTIIMNTRIKDEHKDKNDKHEDKNDKHVDKDDEYEDKDDECKDKDNNDYDNAQTNSPMFTKDLEQAVAAVINFVQLCCQQAAFIAAQGDIQEKIYTNCAHKHVCNTFTQQ